MTYVLCLPFCATQKYGTWTRDYGFTGKSELVRPGQTRGVGRQYCFLAKETKDNNQLKTINPQKCSQIELYENLTTKELKKKHSSRLIGGTEIHSQGRDDVQQGGSWRTRGVRQKLVDWGGEAVSYTHLTLPTIVEWCRSRWSPYH